MSLACSSLSSLRDDDVLVYKLISRFMMIASRGDWLAKDYRCLFLVLYVCFFFLLGGGGRRREVGFHFACFCAFFKLSFHFCRFLDYFVFACPFILSFF